MTVVGWPAAGRTASVPPFPCRFNLGLDSEYEEMAAFGTITYYFTRAVRRRRRRAVLRPTTRPPCNRRIARRSATHGLRRFGHDVFARAALAGERRHHALCTRRQRLSSRRAERAIPVGSSIVLPHVRLGQATNYELGIKTDFFDGMLRLDAAVFFIDWEDIQLLVSDVAPSPATAMAARPRARAWSGRRLGPGDRLTIVGPAPTRTRN